MYSFLAHLMTDMQHPDGGQEGTTQSASADNDLFAQTSISAFVDPALAPAAPPTLTAVYHVSTRDGGQRRQAHLVITGPEGFHLCFCLHLIRTGRMCRHFFAVLADFAVKDGIVFNPETLHPRWREAGRPWSMSGIHSKPIGPESCVEGANELCETDAAQREVKANKPKEANRAVLPMGKRSGTRLR